MELEGEVKTVTTKDGQTYQSLSVIFAPGAGPRTLNIKGEGKLRGKGVSYCATCDADFFEELDILVIGNGDAAIEEAMYLTKFAESVTVVVIHDEGILDCNKMSAEKAFENPKIKWIWNSVLEEIIGDELVESAVVKNLKTGERSTMEVNGVFFFVGTVPKTEFLKGHITLDEWGYIPTTDLMETNVPGVYAVGDARAKYLRQVITAAADGAIAACAAEKYLHEMETFRKQVLEADKPVVLVFWQPQVGDSIAYASQVESLAASNPNVIVVKMDLNRNKKTAETFSVTQTPTVLLIDKGEVRGRVDGMGSDGDIKALIQKA
jgi:thioredoxin reductase (NADPH)